MGAHVESDSVFDKAVNPYLQGGIVFGLMLVISLGGVALRSSGVDIDQSFPWVCSASFMLFFAIFNSLFSISTKNYNQYWGRSMTTWLVLAVVGGLVAWGLSFQTISEAGSYRWIYIVLTIGYLIFLAMMGFLKRIVEFAMREEWSQPRTRDKKR